MICWGQRKRTKRWRKKWKLPSRTSRTCKNYKFSLAGLNRLKGHARTNHKPDLRTVTESLDFSSDFILKKP